MAVAKKSKASSKGLGKGLGNLIRESEEDENVVVKEVVKEVVVKFWNVRVCRSVYRSKRPVKRICIL